MGEGEDYANAEDLAAAAEAEAPETRAQQAEEREAFARAVFDEVKAYEQVSNELAAAEAALAKYDKHVEPPDYDEQRVQLIEVVRIKTVQKASAWRRLSEYRRKNPTIITPDKTTQNLAAGIGGFRNVREVAAIGAAGFGLLLATFPPLWALATLSGTLHSPEPFWGLVAKAVLSIGAILGGLALLRAARQLLMSDYVRIELAKNGAHQRGGALSYKQLLEMAKHIGEIVKSVGGKG